MRAFLRPASSPWIVFDRDSRVDDFATSALRLGKVFASSPSFVEDPSGDVVSSVPLDRPITEPPPKAQTRSDAPPLPPPTIDPGVAAVAPPAVAAPKRDAFADGAVLGHAMSSVLPSTGVFPPSTGAPDAVVEPSNLVVATDVICDESSSELSSSGEVALVAPRSAGRRRLAFVAGACACVLALAGAAVLAAGGRAQTKAAAAAQAAPTAEVVQAAAAPVVDPPAPTLELDQADPPASDEASASKPEKKSQFGKLTIKNEAKYKNVYFDGKRMLGTGQRTFLVYCGKHTIAVNDKADAKEVEIPCSGEYVVSK